MDQLENLDDYIQLRELQHFAYCRRQWALIFLDNKWESNEQTVYGDIIHNKKAHTQLHSEKRGSIIRSYDLQVVSHEYKLFGICDCVEFHKRSNGARIFGYDGYYEVLPVEYKSGREQDVDLYQAADQALCLEEMLSTPVISFALYYKKDNKRVEYTITDELKEKIAAYSKEMIDYKKRKIIPHVRRKSHCRSCSLNNLCIPKIQNKSANEYLESKINSL